MTLKNYKANMALGELGRFSLLERIGEGSVAHALIRICRRVPEQEPFQIQGDPAAQRQATNPDGLSYADASPKCPSKRIS